ncbi:helix-turn-helix transcriptional regulator [Gemella sp. GH3]|uniref:helix-turn-helix domain-containing protein n=1 Tax=unclassified Gemella TaxID=2624949 RepID=UPI0015CFD62D|nr:MULTISPECIES: helix-turn-helix transcriptional regulator [unclassified Gemella]MBF0714524.1 helix-turn-helix transcriptional regulator [Gemella sp. GH3.1]NYS51476.1 helix-turn-helix transcriptional regulator [Gemella sp. GH3]
MNEFKDVVRNKREFLGISRYRLAKESGVNYQTLDKIEKGIVKTVTLRNAVKIANILDIDLNIFKG